MRLRQPSSFSRISIRLAQTTAKGRRSEILLVDPAGAPIDPRHLGGRTDGDPIACTRRLRAAGKMADAAPDGGLFREVAAGGWPTEHTAGRAGVGNGF